MSRWLKSVNNLLESLDGQVENVATTDFSQEFDDDDDYDSDDTNSECESEELESDWDGIEQQQDETELEPFEEQDEIEVVPPEQEQLPPAKHDEPTKHHPMSAPPPPVAAKQPPPPPPVPSPSTEQETTTESFTTAKAPKNAVKPPPPPPPPPPPGKETAVEPTAINPTPVEDIVKAAPPPAPPSKLVESKATAIESLKVAHESMPVHPERKEEPAALHPPPWPVTRPSAPPLSGMSTSSATTTTTTVMDASPASYGAVSLPTSTNAESQQLKLTRRELKKTQTESRQLRKHVLQLDTQLEATEHEMTAQRQELTRAAERLERDRLRHKQELAEVLEEHEEEMDQLKEHYEHALEEQKEYMEKQLEEIQDRLELEEAKRMQEGGDWTKELQDSIEREREALQLLQRVKDDNVSLNSQVSKLQTQQNSLQMKLESCQENLKMANERERQAEDKLDAALSLHSRQLSQRQVREAELERNITELGAALIVAQQKEQEAAAARTASRTMIQEGTTDATELSLSYKQQLEVVTDELETVRVQLSLETQRCEALRQELNEVSQERTEEAAFIRARQEQFDRQVADLTCQNSRLEAMVRNPTTLSTGEFGTSEDARIVKLQKESEDLRHEVSALSEQLLRLQEMNETSRSELLTLTNRLQTANVRAQTAEEALASRYEGGGSTNSGVSYGSSTMRRRFKGDRRNNDRNQSTSVRSIRSALNMSPGRVGEGAEQIAVTIDAIDSWVVETGAFLRHEPFARLAFLLYLILLHLWSFCLVLFHTHSFEKEHGDFGSLTDNGGLPGEPGGAIRGGRHP